MGFPSIWAEVSIPRNSPPALSLPLAAVMSRSDCCGRDLSGKILHVWYLTEKEITPKTVPKILTAKIKTPLFTWKRRGNGYELLLGIFQIDTRGIFFPMSTISLWNNLHREMVDSQTLLRFSWAFFSRSCFCQERLDQMMLEVPYSMMPWVCDCPPSSEGDRGREAPQHSKHLTLVPTVLFLCKTWKFWSRW